MSEQGFTDEGYCKACGCKPGVDLRRKGLWRIALDKLEKSQPGDVALALLPAGVFALFAMLIAWGFLHHTLWRIGGGE